MRLLLLVVFSDSVFERIGSPVVRIYSLFNLFNFRFSLFRSVHEVTQELLRLLTQRASSQPAGAVPFLQSQEDVAKLKNLFELQADR